MLIGIVGLNGSGKDTVADYLVTTYNWAHKDLGQEIRDELKILGRDYQDRSVMTEYANYKRKTLGADYWCKKALSSLNSDYIVITSIRNPAEAQLIKTKGGKIVEIFAEDKTRFDRTRERVKNNPNAHGDVESFEQFKARQQVELEHPDPSKQQLLACIAMADYRLDNDSSKESLYKQVDELFKKLE